MSAGAGFLIGLFVGVFVGLVLSALMQANGRDDEVDGAAGWVWKDDAQ